MRVRVRFRFNTESGEVELFQVDDVGGGFGPAHDAEHDRISAELGGLLARRPDVEEVTGTEERPLWRHDPIPAARQADGDTEDAEQGERERE
ncbi:hypothetical protein ABZZ79_18145 [Streptomyces sp. NPDC006458]|uniref:hypothetical protein n=1 Tax=Streptomyces sp. NPDC006458 TaxID=3154302 RepID=UPI0033B312AE